ncbi:DUF799 domain-containing protein [Solimonas marina]|uniref:DUF799 domain-containing protein n=1 Tax=Solimonas marina TaxID=2714601 RepID=A0A969W9P2_9GAMM|nr:DUF799 domain-containing protein [Solimonas marina]NKF22129.1 DUF799 domain-containing protein [Solimonas marina]
MNTLRTLRLLALCAAAALLGACATTSKPGYDYTNFRQSHPASILLLPPVNDTNSVGASYSLLSQMTLPLAESGYYVLPVSLVDETFRQNGYTNPAEIEGIPIDKLYKIFHADAALYVHIKQFGTVYQLIISDTVVSAEARLVDLRTGSVLWAGKASASSSEDHTNTGGGLAGLLLSAIVNQIVEATTDRSHDIAGVTSLRLLSAGQPAGMLYGPRSPKYQAQQQP